MKTFKRALCIFLIVVMCLTSAPLQGFVGMEWPELSEISFGGFELPKIDFDSWFGSKANAAETLIYGDFEYVVNDDSNVAITRYIGNGVNVLIPDQINGTTVTIIGSSAFFNCDSIEIIDLPETIIGIDSYAFQSCDNLSKVVIPDGVSFIGEGAFRNCEKLMQVCIENPMTEIQRYAFDKTALYNNHPNGVVYIDNIAIGYKGEVPEDLNLVIKDGTVAIADYFFYFDKWNNTYDYNESKKLKSLVLPNSLIKIGKCSFTDCGSLHTLKLGDNLKTVLGFGNVRLQNLYVNNVESLLNIDFSEWGLSTINLFINGELATDLYIPEGAEKITYGTMRVLHSSSVTGIYVPNSVKDIEEYSLNNFVTYCNQNSYAADYCGVYDLPCVYVDAGNEINVIGGNVAYDSDLTWCLDKRTGLLEITGTGELYDFYDEKSAPWYEFRDFITSIVVPEHFSLIGDYSFYGLYRVNKVIIPDNVRIIGEQAFYGCGIYEISLPQTLTTIETKAFFSNQFFNIVIPNSVTTIESYAFGHCINLSYIYIPKNVNSIGDMCFNGNLMSEFDVDENNNFYSSFEGVLYDKNKTKLIQFPVNSNISTFTIPDSVKTIQKYAFYSYEDNRNLNIIIPNSVEYIEQNAFENENIINISMGNGIISIGSEAFRGTMIKEIFLPDTVQEMGYGIFEGCERLTAIEIPDNITQIGKEMFRLCQNLKSITIPKSVKLISGYAFYVTSLRDIYYKGSEKQWNNIEIENWGNEYYLSNATIHFLGEDEPDEPDNPDEPENTGYQLNLRSAGAYSDSIAVGEKIKFYAFLWENNKILDCERAYAISFDNPGVFNVVNTEITESSFDVTLKATGAGTTNMTISDNVTGAYVTIKLKAAEPINAMNLYEFDDSAKEYDDILTHIYNQNGIYINGFNVNENRDGSYHVYMNAYNEKPHYGAVVSYDKDGNVYKYALIKQKQQLPTNLWSGVYEVFDWFTYKTKIFGEQPYTHLGCTQWTPIDIEVPKDGYLVITNNIKNEIVFLANCIDLSMDLAFAVKDALDYSIPEKVSSEVVEKTIGKIIEEMGMKAFSKFAKGFVKNLTVKMSYTTIDVLLYDLLEAFEVENIKLYDIVLETISETVNEEFWLQLGEDIGLYLAGGGTIKHIFDAVDFVNSCIKSAEFKNSIISSETQVYAPAEDGYKRYSNGVKITSETPLDPDYVLHSYIINEAEDVMADAKPTIEALTSNYQMYDITLYKSSQAVQPNSKIKVMIPIPAGYNKNNIQVYWYKADGTLESMNAKVQGDYAVFETDHLSYYVLVEEQEIHSHSYEIASTVNPTCTETGTITYTCSCGDFYTEVVPATGHMFSEGNSKCSNCDFDRAEGCDCKCHKGGISGFFFKIILFFQKIFKQNKYCSGCGVAHY